MSTKFTAEQALRLAELERELGPIDFEIDGPNRHTELVFRATKFVVGAITEVGNAVNSHASESKTRDERTHELLEAAIEPKIKMKKEIKDLKSEQASAQKEKESLESELERTKSALKISQHNIVRFRKRNNVLFHQNQELKAQAQITGTADEVVTDDIDDTPFGTGGTGGSGGSGMASGANHSYVPPPSPKFPGQTKASIKRRYVQLKGKTTHSSKGTNGKRKRGSGKCRISLPRKVKKPRPEEASSKKE